MESTARLWGAGQARRWQWLAVILAAAMLLGAAAAPFAGAQETTESAETPDVVIPGTGDADEEAGVATPAAAPEVTPTEEAADVPPADTSAPSAASTDIQISPTDPGFPAVMAHGLAFLTGEQSVWQVREVEPDGPDSATSEVSNAAFVWQVEGASVIRNDVSGKRALLNPGEAYFKAGGDAYTTFAESDDSLIWIFEVVSPSEVASDAFYESPLIDDYEEGVFDMLIVRYVLEPGASVTLPDHTGPALVMSIEGDIDVESGGLGLLATGDGQLITADATVSNNSDSPAVFAMPAFGAAVDDSTTGAGTTSTDAAADTTTETEPPADDGTETDAATDEPTTTDEPEVTDEPAVTDPPATDSEAGGAQTSINITAEAELYVVVVADGVTVFDGPIPDGGQSGEIVGTTFEVYTSSGAATRFTNACGESFYMGFDEGEATYTLTATPESC